MAAARGKKKYVDEIKAYGINWATRLSNANDGAADTINTSTWSIAPVGITTVADSIDTGNTRTKIKVSGGAVGVVYTLQNTIVLVTSGYTLQDYIKITVADIN